MSKDYRYQRDEWDSVEEEDFHAKKPSSKRQSTVKENPKLSSETLNAWASVFESW